MRFIAEGPARAREVMVRMRVVVSFILGAGEMLDKILVNIG